MQLKLFKQRYMVAKLPTGANLPPDIWSGPFCCVTKTEDELSFVLPESASIDSPHTERGWRILQIAEKLDFNLVGILAKLTVVLAEQNIPVFAVSTYNTDYILVKEKDLEKAISALTRNGYQIEGTTKTI